VVVAVRPMRVVQVSIDQVVDVVSVWHGVVSARRAVGMGGVVRAAGMCGCARGGIRRSDVEGVLVDVVVVQVVEVAVVEVVDVVVVRDGLVPAGGTVLVGMGIVPIITHPERNWMIQQNFETMEEWVKVGALVQVTGGSLTGRFGKPAQKFAVQTIDRGICHFIASDAHDTRDRHPKLRSAYEIVQGKWGEDLAERLFTENGKAVIEGAPIDRELPVKKKRWFFF